MTTNTEKEAEMNELIRELIHQTNEWMEVNAQGEMWEREQKFAQLIVKECVKKCRTDWYGDSLDDICIQMLEHFGVE